jgi:hypothetical protein
LGVGEALVSMLQEKAVPMPVERALICPPRCRMGALTPAERDVVRVRSPLGGKYDVPVNRESAHEILTQRALNKQAAEPGAANAGPARPPERGILGDLLWGTKGRQGMVETLAKQTVRTVGSQIGRQILRGVLGGILGGSRRR